MPVETLTDARVRGIKRADGEVIDAKSGMLVRADRAGAVTFSFRYRHGGARRRIVIGRFPAVSLATARAAAGRLREQIRNGADPQRDRQTQRAAPAALSFDALADVYLERYARPTKASWKNDEGYLRTYARPVLGKRAAASITKQDAARLLFDVAAAAPVTANRLRSVLMKLFGWACDSALLEDNPLLGVKKPHREGRGKTRFLDDAEIAALWRGFDQARAAPGTIAALKTLLLLGQRPGEVAGMAVSELQHLDDAAAARWELPAQRTKARRAHVVPLPPLAREIVQTELARQTNPEHVFSSQFTARTRLARQSLAVALGRIVDDLDHATLKADPPTPHDLRRTAATGMARLGIPRDDRLAVMAHSYSDVHSVYDRYDRLAEKRAALEAWERHLRKAIAVTP